METIIFGGQNGNIKVEKDIKFIGFADKAKKQLIVEEHGKRMLYARCISGYAGYSLSLSSQGNKFEYEFVSSTNVPQPLKKYLTK